jgi:type IV secretory pathway VirB2 component (pilin)
MDSAQGSIVRQCNKTAVLLLLFLVPAFVTVAGTTNDEAPLSMPWEHFLNTLAADLTGSTAILLAISAVFVAGLALIFGEDHEKFMLSLLMLAVVLSLLIVAVSFIPPSILCRTIGPSVFSACKARPPTPKACRGAHSNTCRG